MRGQKEMIIASGVAQVVASLPNKHEAPVLVKKKKKKKKPRQKQDQNSARQTLNHKPCRSIHVWHPGYVVT
jgi:hypothetical protein